MPTLVVVLEMMLKVRKQALVMVTRKVPLDLGWISSQMVPSSLPPVRLPLTSRPEWLTACCEWLSLAACRLVSM